MAQHRLLWPAAALLVVALIGSAGEVQAQRASAPAPGGSQSSSTRPLGDGAARAFVEEAEVALEPLSDASTAANWTATVETNAENSRRAAEADAALNAETVRRGTLARDFSASDPVIRRKLERLRLWADGLNANPRAGERRAQLEQQMASFYEQACPVVDAGLPCLQHDVIERELRTERDSARLRRLWEAWYNAAAPQIAPYCEYTDLLNQGARDSGRRDAAEVSLAAYEVDPASFERELDALWAEVRLGQIA